MCNLTDPSIQWGDAPVHSLAVTMLLRPQQVHYFSDFGYRHDWYFSCPKNAKGRQLPELDALNLGGSKTWQPEHEGGLGCRCECDAMRRSPHGSYCTKRLTQPSTRHRWSRWAWFKSWFW
jgi:mannosyltransferase